MCALFLLIPTVSGIMPLTAASTARPPSANIANFVVKTDNLDEARRFYEGVLGYDEVFRHKRAVSGPAELSVFKVNERQYIEVLSLIHISEPTRLGLSSYAVFCLKQKILSHQRVGSTASALCMHTNTLTRL